MPLAQLLPLVQVEVGSLACAHWSGCSPAVHEQEGIREDECDVKRHGEATTGSTPAPDQLQDIPAFAGVVAVRHRNDWRHRLTGAHSPLEGW